MRNPWRLFILIESILFVVLGYQIFKSPPMLVWFILGVLALIWASRFQQNRPFKTILTVFGVLSILIIALTNAASWLIILFTIIFVALKGYDFNAQIKEGILPWQKKNYQRIEAVEPTIKDGKRFKRIWIGNQHIGENSFEWDDLTFSLLMGDTIVDLGNTILPKEDNVIIIQKGFGKTRILVPIDVGVMVEHSALFGEVHFEQKSYHLKNESVKLYSSNYQQNTRHLKIVTNCLFGDIEVIAI